MANMDILTKLFKKGTPVLVGIDIGSHSVKAVLLSNEDGHYRLDAALVEPLPKGAVVDRNVHDIETVARVINKIRKKIPKHIKYAAAAVSGQTVISKVIYMDVSLTDEELESQIMIEADSLIPYPLDEVSLDFERQAPNDIDPSKVNVLLSAARTESIQTRASAILEGGFTAKVVDVESYALSRVIELVYKQLPDDAREKNVALIDIGASMSLLSVVNDGEVIYTRDQLFGGEQYTQSIVSYYNKSYEDAELAKVNNDLPPNYTFEVLAPFQTSFLQQIRRGMQMFLASSGKDQLDYIVLSGGSAAIPGLDRLLIEELGIHTIVANPFASMDIMGTIDREQLAKQQAQMMVATGLALRSFNPCHM